MKPLVEFKWKKKTCNKPSQFYKFLAQFEYSTNYMLDFVVTILSNSGFLPGLEKNPGFL